MDIFLQVMQFSASASSHTRTG